MACQNTDCDCHREKTNEELTDELALAKQFLAAIVWKLSLTSAIHSDGWDKEAAWKAIRGVYEEYARFNGWDKDKDDEDSEEGDETGEEVPSLNGEAPSPTTGSDTPADPPSG